MVTAKPEVIKIYSQFTLISLTRKVDFDKNTETTLASRFRKDSPD